MKENNTYYPDNQKKYEQGLSAEAKAHRRNLKNFSSAKSFIKLHATDDQLNDIIELAQSKLDEKNNIADK